MTEIDKLKYAKMFIDNLAHGVNPIDGSPTAENDVVNNVNVSRCLFYVSDILRLMIDEGSKAEYAPLSKPAKKSRKLPFNIAPSEIEQFEISDEPVSIKIITQQINSLIDTNIMKSLKPTSLNEWLLSIDLLTKITDVDGRIVKRPTMYGIEMGMSTEERLGEYGSYTVVVYNREAQKFIVDNIEAAIEINNRERIKTDKSGFYGKLWTKEQEETLIDLYNSGISTHDIAKKMQRSGNAIIAHLEKLGYITK